MTVRQIDHLVKMANQIALNLGAGQDDNAAAQRTRQHLKLYWTPAMRRELTDHWHRGGDVLPVVATALAALEAGDRD